MAKMPPRIELYRAVDGWRWRLMSLNGKIVAESGEAYCHRHNALRGVHRAMKLLLTAEIVIDR